MIIQEYILVILILELFVLTIKYLLVPKELIVVMTLDQTHIEVGAEPYILSKEEKRISIKKLARPFHDICRC